MLFDGVTYLRCEDCGEFIVEGEAMAHERSCSGSSLRCRICGDQVSHDALRDHLVGHNTQAAHLDSDEVRDQFVSGMAA